MCDSLISHFSCSLILSIQVNALLQILDLEKTETEKSHTTTIEFASITQL